MDNSIDYIALGARIRKCREDLNMTQADLSEACSLSTSYIGHIERGTRTLSLESLFKIASVLKVSMDYLTSDSLNTSQELFTSIQASLQYKNQRQINAFLKTVKILADNIEKL